MAAPFSAVTTTARGFSPTFRFTVRLAVMAGGPPAIRRRAAAWFVVAESVTLVVSKPTPARYVVTLGLKSGARCPMSSVPSVRASALRVASVESLAGILTVAVAAEPILMLGCSGSVCSVPGRTSTSVRSSSPSSTVSSVIWIVTVLRATRRKSGIIDVGRG